MELCLRPAFGFQHVPTSLAPPLIPENSKAMAAVEGVVCSRCSGRGHRAADCVKPFYRVCNHCKQLGHLVKACPELKAKRESKEKKEKENDARSESEVSTTASEWSGKSTRSRGSRKGNSNGAVGQWQPHHWVLSEDEEREARKLEKKLREISALERMRDEGRVLDVLQQQKLQRKSEIEGHDILRKVRLGYRRAQLPALAE